MLIQNKPLRKKYTDVVEKFTQKVKEDENILAALVIGSVASGEIWERSDIDIWLIGNDEQRPYQQFTVVEENIDIQIELYEKSQFFKLIESEYTNFYKKAITSSHLLFSKDETITECFHKKHILESKEKKRHLFINGVTAIITLIKAEKDFYFSKDLFSSFSKILRLVESLALIEVLYNDMLPGKDILNTALEFNPKFFQNNYIDLVQNSTDYEKLESVLECAYDYLIEKTPILFQPILQYLSQTGEKPTSVLSEHFKKLFSFNNDGGQLSEIYNWLAKLELLNVSVSSVRLTESNIEFNESSFSIISKRI